MFPLLIDTDAFYKLALGGVLDDALQVLGAARPGCYRLPALQPMLRRGRLYRSLGVAASEALEAVAATLPVIPSPADPAWLDRVTGVPAIDPGEALLFAVGAEHESLVITGDKRALEALKSVEGFAARFSGRIVLLEALLTGVCQSLGSEVVRARVKALKEHDAMVRVAFSDANPDPQVALASYFVEAAARLAPLTLWKP